MEYGRDHYGVSRFREQEINNIKKVGVPRLGGAFHYNMIPILENMGVNPDEVEFVAAGANIISRITLLDRGDVDFILLAEEDLGKLSRDKYNILPPESILEKGDYITGVIATGDKLKNKKSEIQSYLNVIVRTRNYLLDEKNKEEMIALFKKELELSDDNALTYYETMIESRKGVSLIPDESVLDRITRAVAKVSSPQNPGRSLTDFVFKDLAKKAEKN
jgi:ABC-type nitrate/sulfonate/bicarbonate transport system substrate-binding protein